MRPNPTGGWAARQHTVTLVSALTNVAHNGHSMQRAQITTLTFIIARHEH